MHVPNALYRGFSTLEDAKGYYLDAKKNGDVRIVRDPGDNALFGPEDDAIQ